jgi:hypothetical protein
VSGSLWVLDWLKRMIVRRVFAIAGGD